MSYQTEKQNILPAVFQPELFLCGKSREFLPEMRIEGMIPHNVAGMRTEAQKV